MPALAIFVHDLSATGVVRNALAVAGHMKASGWRVSLVTCRPDGMLARQIPDVDWVCLRPKPRHGRSRALDLALSIGRLRRVVRALAPDVLLSAGNHAHLPCCLAMAGMRRPLRVYRISNDLSHGRAAARFSPRRLGARMLVRDAAALVLVSPSLAGDVAFASDAVRRKLAVIPNGVDVARVRELAAAPGFASLWQAEGDPVVLAVGRLVPQKNFATLVEAVAIASRTRPLRLAILGQGSAAARAELEARARARGIVGSLIMPGTSDNPFAAMRRAAAVAVPSLWEGSPNVLLEAMAVGAPVVAASTAGNAAEILDNGRYGLLVDPRDAAAMAAALLQQTDPARRVMPGMRAESFDRTIALERYRNLLLSLESSI